MKIPLLFTSTLLAAAWGYSIQVGDDKSCSIAGAICSDDSKAVLFCPDSGGQPIALFECSSGEYCSTKSGLAMCDSTTPEKSTQVCAKQGPMPSPINSAQYYVCTELGEIDPPLFTCKEGTVFDTYTDLCSKEIPNRDTVDCGISMAGFVDPPEEQYRYVCDSKGFPIVYPNVEAFFELDDDGNSTATSTTVADDDGDSTSTTTNDDGDSTSSTTTTTTTTTTTPPTTTTTTTTPPTTTPTTTPPTTTTTAPVQCTTTGERHPAPDCHSYYQCNGPNDPSPTLKTCPPGFFYSSSAFACVRGSC